MEAPGRVLAAKKTQVASRKRQRLLEFLLASLILSILYLGLKPYKANGFTAQILVSMPDPETGELKFSMALQAI